MCSVETVIANLEVIHTLWEATPADFRFPILTRLNKLAETYLDILPMQLVINPPMSMMKVKDIYQKNIDTLDLCPLIFRAFAGFCKEFLAEIHGSDFCVPTSAKNTDSAFIQGFGISSFEDRAGLRFRNANRKIKESINYGEMKAAKYLAERHQQQDDLMRAIWNAIQVSQTQWEGPPPVLPKITKIYNECEPQVVGKTSAMFEWFERPNGPTKSVVLDHISPIVDEIPTPLAKFPSTARYVPLVNSDDRNKESCSLDISPISTPIKSDTSINKTITDKDQTHSTPVRVNLTQRLAKSKFTKESLS